MRKDVDETEATAQRPGPAKGTLRMRPRYGKFAYVAVCLMQEAERLGVSVTTFELVKAVFIADKTHLRRYRRPITFDRYLAMKNGPVGHTFYNMLKEDPRVLALTGPVRWRRREAAEAGSRYWADRGPIWEYHSPERVEDMEDVLSESDVEELHKALREVKRLGVSRLWRKLHRDRGWLAAWSPLGGKASYPMDPALLFDKPDEKGARGLAYISRQYW